MPKDILVSSEDCDCITVGDQLQVLYNASLDDVVAADYTAACGRIVFVLMRWIIIGW